MWILVVVGGGVGDLSWSTAGGGDPLPTILDKLVAFGNSENPVRSIFIFKKPLLYLCFLLTYLDWQKLYEYSTLEHVAP
jgi:hypothetical protein